MESACSVCCPTSLCGRRRTAAIELVAPILKSTLHLHTMLGLRSLPEVSSRPVQHSRVLVQASIAGSVGRSRDSSNHLGGRRCQRSTTRPPLVMTSLPVMQLGRKFLAENGLKHVRLSTADGVWEAASAVRRLPLMESNHCSSSSLECEESTASFEQVVLLSVGCVCEEQACLASEKRSSGSCS